MISLQMTLRFPPLLPPRLFCHSYLLEPDCLIRFVDVQHRSCECEYQLRVLVDDKLVGESGTVLLKPPSTGCTDASGLAHNHIQIRVAVKISESALAVNAARRGHVGELASSARNADRLASVWLEGASSAL